MTDERSQLHRLSVPFPEKYVEKKEGADYVSHAIVNQRLLGTIGPFDMRIDQVIRGDIDERTTGNGKRTWPARQNAVVGVVLTCTFTIDGQRIEISEIGEPEGYYMAAHDGERLKKAVSDAFKRCAMRVGVGLDMWSKGTHFLPRMLETDSHEAEVAAPAPQADIPEPDDVVNAEPERTVTDDGEIVDEPNAPMVTESQLKRLGILQRELDIDRDNFIEQWVRPKYRVESRKDLTQDQASELINTLQGFSFQNAVKACDTLADLETLAGDIKKSQLTGEPRRKLGEVWKGRKAQLELGPSSAGGGDELDAAMDAAFKSVEVS